MPTFVSVLIYIRTARCDHTSAAGQIAALQRPGWSSHEAPETEDCFFARPARSGWLQWGCLLSQQIVPLSANCAGFSEETLIGTIYKCEICRLESASPNRWFVIHCSDSRLGIYK